MADSTTKPDLPQALSRRAFLGSAAAMGGFALSGSQWPGVLTHRREKPNILFIMDDQHRGDALGADGNPTIKTPNLDAIAEEGACFRRAYSSTPSCTPARAALLTGKSPWGHGMLGYDRIASAYPIEKPRLLGQAGYRTMSIGKNHYHPQRNTHGYDRVILDESGRVESEDFRSDYRAWLASVAPLADPDATGIGFNSYRTGAYVLPEAYHPTRWTADTAIQFLEHYDDHQPFYLKVSFARPHSPYDPPQRFLDLYENEDLPQADVGDWAEDWYGDFQEKEPDTLARGNLGAAQVRHSRQGYYGSVSFIDEQIGRMIQVLRRRDLLRHTLVVFLSDHGDMLGDHHLWRKTYAYEGSARVPMLIRWPEEWMEAKRGQHLYQPVEMRDVLPTFLDMAKAELPAAVEGRSMLSLIKNTRAPWRPYLDLEHATTYFDENVWTALTDGRWKYIYHAFDGREQLFDLSEDPGELSDLTSLSIHDQECRRWRSRMVDHLQVRGTPWVVDGALGLRPDRITRGVAYPG